MTLPLALVALLERLRAPGEIGAGDTIARLLESAGISAALRGTLGLVMPHGCGCDRRHAELNAQYPWNP